MTLTCLARSRALRPHYHSSLMLRPNRLPSTILRPRKLPSISYRLQLRLSSSNSPSPSPSQSQPLANGSSPPPPPTYTHPTTGLLSHLPPTWIPYAELIRLDKPAGSLYLFFPCLFGTLMASTHTLASPTTLLSTTFLFLSGAIVMRGAGCTINDLWDRNLDPHVARTRLRPIARGAVTPQQAIVFTGFQLLVGLGVLLQFPAECFWYAAPSLVLVGLYPLAKRVTHYPQAVLGLAFSWGTWVAFPALGVDLLASANADALKAAALLYSSCVSWTLVYDMVYAHQDVRDDRKVGIKSIALRHEKESKAVLSGLSVVQVGLLAASGAMLGFGPGFYVVSCGGAAVTLGTMIRRVELGSVESCWWWFKYGAWFTGGVISAGLGVEYVERKMEYRGEEKEEQALLVGSGSGE